MSQRPIPYGHFVLCRDATSDASRSYRSDASSGGAQGLDQPHGSADKSDAAPQGAKRQF